MSDTVIILQDECILAAEGKEGRIPKVSRSSGSRWTVTVIL